MMIKTVIIDDETNARDTLKSLIQKTNVPIEIVAEGYDIPSALNIIETHQPDLVFLDIQLKTGTGFDLLTKMPHLDSEIIFVTAHDNYAIKAFQMAAFGYLLKPLQINELQEVLSRFEQRFQSRKQSTNRTRVLIDNFDEGAIKKLVIQNVNGFRVLSLSDIIYLKGAVNYTRFILKNGEKLMTSKTLKEYDNLLTTFGFFRIHQSSLINLRYVQQYLKGEGGEVLMSNGDRLDVSRRRKQQFVARFLGR